MGNDRRRQSPPGPSRRDYALGLGVGPVLALYGLLAMLAGKAFLPGSHSMGGGGHTVTGSNAFPLAAAYLCGGLYLIARFYLDRIFNSAEAHSRIYVLQIALIGAFIASLIYVLVHVGAVQ